MATDIDLVVMNVETIYINCSTKGLKDKVI